MSVIYQGSRFKFAVVAVPVLLFLGSFCKLFFFLELTTSISKFLSPQHLAMSIVVIVETTTPSQSFWSTIAVKFALAYYGLTVTLTIVSTALLVFRILSARRRLRGLLGEVSS